jgi:hypothetical protein
MDFAVRTDFDPVRKRLVLGSENLLNDRELAQSLFGVKEKSENSPCANAQITKEKPAGSCHSPAAPTKPVIKQFS